MKNVLVRRLSQSRLCSARLRAPRAKAKITLLAVGPMRAPTQKIVATFEAKTGHKVKVTYGNGVETRRTVAKGQPLDVSIIIAPFPGAIASGPSFPTAPL